jgi:hypothetical protein
LALVVSETSLWELARVVASVFDRVRSSVSSAHAVGGPSSDEHFVVVDGLLFQKAEASFYIFV